MAASRLVFLLIALTQPALLEAATLAEALILCRTGNYGAAVQIMKPLASAGDAHAMTWLAWMHDTGLGVTRNASRAAALYRAAAGKGVQLAQINLATKYWQGDGVEKDVQQGDYWMRKAAAGDHTNTTDLLEADLTGYRTHAITHDWYSAPQAGGTHHAKRRRRHTMAMTSSPIKRASATTFR